MTILVQIAAYRDMELGPTVQDCLSKAKRPDNVRFGICLQDDLTTDYGIDFNRQHIKLIRVHWRESQGVCWARRLVQGLYDGEDFILQIDSHHRFAEHWDERLLEDFQRCDSLQPILSTYPGSYDPVSGNCTVKAPNKILVSRFDHNGSLKRYPLGYKARSTLRPIPARFIAAGFLFTRGQFCEDIPYDAEMYFSGEEPSLTVRAFTHGYDIFHPQQTVLWHEYTRDSKPKHWFDHVKVDAGSNTASETNNKITELEASDIERFYAMLSGTKPLKFGLGSVRSVHDYERFAGLDFDHKVVHQHTRLGVDPSDTTEANWLTNNEIAIQEKQRLKTWFTKIDLTKCLSTLRQAKIGILTYYDRDNQMIDRVTIQTKLTPDEALFEQELASSAPPARWILTGFAQNNQWEQIRSARIHDYRLIA